MRKTSPRVHHPHADDRALRWLAAHSLWIAFALSSFGGGCIGSIGSEDDSEGNSKYPSGGSADPNGDGAVEKAPESANLAAVSGLRRLTVNEYDNTLRDLIGDTTRPSAVLLPDGARTPFDNDYTDQEASQALIEGAEILAQEASERLLADPARLATVVGCTPSGPGDADCLRSFVETFGRKAFRRPLTQTEAERYMVALDLSTEAGDFHVAIDTVLRAMLQDPKFLYRVELGKATDQPGLFHLDAFELATRLSYLLWGSTPDAALLDIAEHGDLASPEQVRAVAAEMLADERARERVDRFHALWLGYESLPHEEWLARGMRTETRALLDRVIFDEQRPWQDILRLDETFVNDALAEHYGLALPGSEEPVWTSYAGTDRAGLLSQGTFLANGAKGADTSPTLRGLAIRTRLFCQPIPPPPANVKADDGAPETENAVCKVDRYAVHAQGGCANCHKLMDPVGFGLENYDKEGRYRDVEEAHPECTIEGQGNLDGVGDFRGPRELAELALETGIVNQCLAKQLYSFAVGRHDLDETDNEFVDLLTKRMGDGDFRFDELVLEFVADPSFSYRRENDN